MTRGRRISSAIWGDPWFEALESGAELLFVYLWANERARTGRYEISARKMAFDTGLDALEVERALASFGDAVVWDADARTVEVVKRRFRRAGTRPEGAEWRATRSRVFARDDDTCRYCGVRGGRLECDHVVPLSRGGSSEDDNLAAACYSCNRSKRAHLVEEWR